METTYTNGRTEIGRFLPDSYYPDHVLEYEEGRFLVTGLEVAPELLKSQIETRKIEWVTDETRRWAEDEVLPALSRRQDDRRLVRQVVARASIALAVVTLLLFGFGWLAAPKPSPKSRASQPAVPSHPVSRASSANVEADTTYHKDMLGLVKKATDEAQRFKSASDPAAGATHATLCLGYLGRIGELNAPSWHQESQTRISAAIRDWQESFSALYKATTRGDLSGMSRAGDAYAEAIQRFQQAVLSQASEDEVQGITSKTD